MADRNAKQALNGETRGYYDIHTQTGLYRLEDQASSGWKTSGLHSETDVETKESRHTEKPLSHIKTHC